MLKWHMPETVFNGLFLVISGGQAGSDQGGLEAASEMSVLTGGVAPMGWQTCRGPKPQLAKFGLTPDSVPGYQNRTRLNVDGADGTTIIASNPSSPGTAMTIRHARKTGKPCLILIVGPNDTLDEFEEHGRRLAEWIRKERVSILNVAGNRDSYGSFFHHDAAKVIVTAALLDLYNTGNLVLNEV